MSREKDLATLVGQARLAFEKGAPIFAPKLKTSAWSPPDHGEVEVFSESIAAVESLGWHLAHWAVAPDSTSAICGYPVFRRDNALIQDRV